MKHRRADLSGEPVQPGLGNALLLHRMLSPLAFRLANHARIRAARASLSALPLVGGMASIPSRAASLPLVIDHALPQLDRLHLFLHGYAAVPPGVERPGVNVHLAPATDPYRASGKFYGLSREGPCLYFGLDDDILYLSGYVARLRAGVLRYGGLALVGLHATNHTLRHAGYLRSAKVRHFAHRLLLDERVDELGGGTLAFYSEAFRIDPRTWPDGDMDDVFLAIEAEKRRIPRISLARPAATTRAIAEVQPDSLFRALRRDDTRQTQRLAELRALMKKG